MAKLMSGQIRPLLFSASCSSPLTAAASELWCKLAMVAEAAMAVASFRKVQRERESERGGWFSSPLLR